MTDEPYLSRRQWLGLLSTASLGSGLLAPKAFGDESGSGSGDKAPGARVYNIRDFGAKGDSTTLDTAPVQAAIDACHKEQGGTVLVPAGVFVIGTIEMKSNVTLHLAAAGKLLGSADGKQYHAADAIPLSGDSTLGDGNVGLIFAVGARNIVIEGPGTIDGQGAQFRSPTRGVPPPAGISGSHRPYHLLIHQCERVTVRDIFLTASAFHSIRIIQSRFVWLDGIQIYNRVNHNNDGFHFISSQYVHLSNCDVQCQDDACALFGSCKFVTVTNCSFSTRWSVFRFGGGEAENITVSNCLIYQTYGCPIKMRCGPRSRFENISFSNLVMKNVTGPISIGLGPQGRRRAAPAPGSAADGRSAAGKTGTNNEPLSPLLRRGEREEMLRAAGAEAQTNAPPAAADAAATPGIVRNISFSGIRATVAKPVQLPDVEFVSGYNPGEIFSCIVLNGMGEAFLEKISFNDVHVTLPGGGTAEQGAVRDVPQLAGEYYAIGVPPACALFARNVRGLTLQNVRFDLAGPDLRPAVVFDHVTDAAVNGLSAQGDPQAESLLRFIATRDVLLTAARVTAPAAVFLQVEGAESGGIKIDGGDLSKAAAALAFKAGATAEAVKLRA